MEKSDAKMEVKLEPKLFSELDPKSMKASMNLRKIYITFILSANINVQLTQTYIVKYFVSEQNIYVYCTPLLLRYISLLYEPIC